MVITLHNAMLVALGFLLACLIAFIVAPAYRRRLERLATERVRKLLPMSEAEMRAERDRVRAESAVRVFTLERQVEQARLASARQAIDSSRRDARILELENDVRELRSSLQEAENARIVLEQTITDRLPMVEHRLAEAKKLLYQRDREIAALATEAGKSAKALEEAFHVNLRNRAEIERLKGALNAKDEVGKAANGAAPAASVDLKTELETLRARIRDQAKLIQTLQAVDGDESKARPTYSTDDETVDALRNSLQATEQALAKAQADHAAALAEQSHLAEQQQQALVAKVQEQAATIARLQALVAALEATPADTTSPQAATVTPAEGPAAVSDPAPAEHPKQAINGRDRRPLAERLMANPFAASAAPSGEATNAIAAGHVRNGSAPATTPNQSNRPAAGPDRATGSEEAPQPGRLAERLSSIAKV